MDKKKLLEFIAQQRKIYKDIYNISKEIGPAVADPAKYLGKLEALVEMEYFIKAGDFDVPDELSNYEKYLNDNANDMMKIWKHSAKLPSEEEVNKMLLDIFAPKKKPTPGDTK